LSQPRQASGWIVRLGAVHRIVAALAIGGAAFLLARSSSAVIDAPELIGWDAGALAYLTLTWLLILRADATETREHVRVQDPRTHVIYLLLVVAACASVVALGMVVGPLRQLESWRKALSVSLAVLALVMSWLLIHTIFAVHYARLYYEGDKAEELAFPNDRTPDYLDFAYYAFVIGMTSQVSDVQVKTRRMRRVTLAHGILSFLFNIAVLALAINFISSVIFA
jgi:uncharacterized membrane protein